MKSFARVFVAAILLNTYVLVTPAQKQEATHKQTRPKQTWKITRDYDKAKGQTKLELESIPVTRVKDVDILLGMQTYFAGEKPEAPLDRFIFSLLFFAKSMEPFADSTLSLRVDGKPIDVGPMTFAGEVESGDETGLVYGIPLSGEELSKIADARRVEMSIGGLQFTLGEEQINAILDFRRQAMTRAALMRTRLHTGQYPRGSGGPSRQEGGPALGAATRYRGGY